MTGTKHSAFSTNLILTKSKHNYRQEQQQKPKQPDKETINICINYQINPVLQSMDLSCHLARKHIRHAPLLHHLPQL